MAQPLGAILNYCTLAEMVAMEDEDVKNALQEKVNGKNNRLKIRLQFNTKTDNDGETDMVMWTPNVHYPKITVTYTPPLL